ncbi:hypothetical protein [Falsiroseomonas sp. E2-1-a20]|uniref:hypothetical protein n=1 Tax=Falsiroseomonas sp. E2-1-a20 TaxID=3239300 RepID=UPI003F2CF194
MSVTRRGLGALGAGLGLLPLLPRDAAAQTAVVMMEPLPCLDRQGDIVALLLEGSGAPAGAVVTFGQVFKAGDLPRGAGLVARLADGAGLPVQADVLSRHEDGSARFAVLALAAPQVGRGSRAGVILSRGRAAPARAFDVTPLMARRSITIELNGQAIDLMALLAEGLARRGARPFQSGPLAVQMRVVTPVEVGGVTSLRMVSDVTLRADGEVTLELWMRNDGAMRPGGGAVGYRVRVLLDGQEAMAAEIPRHHQYTAWGRLMHTGAPVPLVRPDPTYLAEAGAAPRYDLTTGVAAGLLGNMARQIGSEDWAQPFNSRGVLRAMGSGGGRPDIGPMTQSQAAWLITGDPRAAMHAIGQAEAAGSIPWHYWDTEAGRWMDTRRWPRLWTDPRGGPPPGGLAQRISGDTGWSLAASHQPDLSYLPWLLTGRRAFLDGLQAQACWCVIGRWPAPRGTAGRPGVAEGVNVVRGNQVRGSAWSLRTLTNAAWASPDEDATTPWLRETSQANWTWVRQQIPRWTQAQGEAHGWIPGEYGVRGALPPWQQDYFASAAAAAARQGSPDARAVLRWMENFLAGRFLAGRQGFPPNDGAAYLLAVNADADARNPLNTWAAIGEATRSGNLSNGDGWSKTQGDYAQLALQSLAQVIDVTGSEDAARAYAWLSEADAPYTRDEDYRRNPLFNIVPRGQPRVPSRVMRCR